MELTTVWFTLIAVLWAGYFLLEGFDFGVGMLLPVLGPRRPRAAAAHQHHRPGLGRQRGLAARRRRRHLRRLPGVVCDPVLRLLPAAADHPRGADPARRSRSNTAARATVHNGSAAGTCASSSAASCPALLWGVAFGNIVRGVPINAEHEYVGTFFTLLNPYALLGGLTTLSLFALHGAVFLALKTDGEMRGRAGRLAFRLSLPAVLLAAAFLVWTQLTHDDAWGWALSAAAAVALIGAVFAAKARREGWAFLATGATLVLAVAALFVTLFPDVMPTTLAGGDSLTVTNASSTPYTLKVMTWVAVCFTPIVLGYQSWTYWVFRRRLRVEHIPASHP